MMKQIDILLSTYNGEKYLKEQLDSLLRQSYQDFQVLVRDDGSTDGTLNIISYYQNKYPQKIILIKDEYNNLGVTLNFSKLLEQSTAEYVMFCDQDDVWLPNKIESTLLEMKRLESIHGSSEALMVFSDLIITDKDLFTLDNSMWKSQKLDPNIIFDLYSILALNVVTGCTMMINNKAKDIVLPIPKENILHDHWIAVNITKYGYASYINETFIKYRQHDTNVMGAKSSGIAYFLNKTKDLIQNIETFKAKYSHFDFHVNLWKVLWQKIILNSRRIF